MIETTIIPLEIMEPQKKKPVKKKKFFVGDIISGVTGIFTGVASLVTNKKQKEKAPPKERYQVIVDNRTGGVNLSYIIAILTVVILIIVIMWVGIKKLKAKK